jgi:hypothetical protein
VAERLRVLQDPIVGTTMEPNNEQAQGLYRLCYRLTNVIYPGWQYRSVEIVRIDERTGNLYVLAGDSLDFEIKSTGGFEP